LLFNRYFSFENKINKSTLVKTIFMKRIYFIILVFLTTSVFSQLSLNKDFYDLISKIKKVNNIVIRMTYLEKPIALTFSREVKLTEMYL